MRRFPELWGEGDNNFAKNSPNAVQSFAEAGHRPPEDDVEVIGDPSVDADVLTSRIEILDGTVPSATGPSALFTHPCGRPLSPVSAAGMHRRARPRR